MKNVRQVFNKLNLKGLFSLRHLDSKHVLIRLHYEGDFNRIWMKELSFIGTFHMCVFRWTPGFRPEVGSSIIPVWISLPNLPLFMFNKQCPFSIGRLIGTPLTIGMPTADFSRPSLAKNCIQLDLLKRLNRIWLECGKAIPRFWQTLEFDKLP